MLTPSSLFSVNESSTLYLEGLTLAGGGGARGGAVAAHGKASVTLVDCAVSGNAVTDSGGEKHKANGGRAWWFQFFTTFFVCLPTVADRSNPISTGHAYTRPVDVYNVAVSSV